MKCPLDRARDCPTLWSWGGSQPDERQWSDVEPSARIWRNPRVEYRNLGDDEGGVLLHLDTAAYHGVNDVGSLVWTLLDGRTFSQVLDELRSKLVSVPPEFEEDIGEFVASLIERDLVVQTEPSAAPG